MRIYHPSLFRSLVNTTTVATNPAPRQIITAGTYWVALQIPGTGAGTASNSAVRKSFLPALAVWGSDGGLVTNSACQAVRSVHPCFPCPVLALGSEKSPRRQPLRRRGDRSTMYDAASELICRCRAYCYRELLRACMPGSSSTNNQAAENCRTGRDH